MRRLLAGLVASALAVTLVLLARPASAHDQLVGSDPGGGAELATAPSRVTLTFNEPVQAAFSTVSVTSPDGVQRSAGRVTADGSSLVQSLQPGGAAGTWRVAYGIVSADGHRVQAQFTFRVTGSDSATSTPVDAPDDDDAGGVPWVLALGGVVAAAVVATAAWQLSRRRG